MLVLSPEPPYPLNGGGAYRTASLIHYFAQFAKVDLVLFSESGQPSTTPKGLLRSQTVIQLPPHSNTTVARYFRNGRRALRGVPPLIDRLSGHEQSLSQAVQGKRYDLGIVEHFWCAPYWNQICGVCNQTALDLHNVESMLHARCAKTGHGLVAAGHSRFARCSRRLEGELLPRYSTLLTTSEEDALIVRPIAPQTKTVVYRNAIPEVSVPEVREESTVVFSGNFEYHPNIDAVRFLVSSIWPRVIQKCPELRLRLVGRGDRFIRHLLPSGLNLETTGALDNTLPEIASARIVIAPLRAGSGTRIKILEAWAAARPVVATELAAEGLECQNSRDLILANDPAAFAGAIVGLNGNLPLRADIAANGRILFERRYTWKAAWRSLDDENVFGVTGERCRYTEET